MLPAQHQTPDKQRYWLADDQIEAVQIYSTYIEFNAAKDNWTNRSEEKNVVKWFKKKKTFLMQVKIVCTKDWMHSCVQ